MNLHSTRTKRAGSSRCRAIVLIALASLPLFAAASPLNDDTARAIADIRALQTALTMYRLDNFRYPSTKQGLDALVTKPTDGSANNWRPGGYLARLTKDPWGNDYQYITPGSHGQEYDLYSIGPGGGLGVIGNWNLPR